MSASRTTTPDRPSTDSPGRRRRRIQWLIVCGILACLAVALVVAAWEVFSRPQGGVAVSARPQSPELSNVASSSKVVLSAAASSSPTDEVTLVDDDGQTLWNSPTAGKPINLAYLPPGVQIIVAARPAALTGHPEGEKVLDSLGPVGQRGFQYLDQVLAAPAGIAELIIGWQTTRDGQWQTAMVVQLSGGATAAEHLAAKLPGLVEQTYHGARYQLASERAYWVPDGKNERLLVVAPAESIAEIIDLEGNPPPLRRDIERLLAHTDAERHLTIVFAPNLLFNEGQNMFSGEMARLREPLFWFLGDELSAAALSMHWDDNFFAELIAPPTLDTSPERAARIFAERVAQTPDRVEDFVVGLTADAYGRRVVARFPAMVRKMAAYTRSGFDTDHAVLRCYLPAVAGHNLLMGAELTLAESPEGAAATDANSPASPPAEVGSPTTVHERLQRHTSLAFARETLEAALEQLSQGIGVEIVILGADLQAEGITKNQSFGVDMTNKPAGEILVEILRLANPDKTASRPNDRRQKLVYVVSDAASGKSEQIVVTTRARAAERGDQLPAVFRAD